MFRYSLAAATLLFASGVVGAQAQQVTVTDDRGLVTLSGGLGILAIESREYVFNGSGSPDYMSLLIWQSKAPVLNTALNVELPQGWSIGVTADAAFAGSSYMEDYDWLAPFAVGTPDMDNWTHRSQHSDTRVDWYFNGSIYAAYKIRLEDGPTLRFHGGFEYTDVQWAAFGGTYIYSTGGFRDDAGDFGSGRSITYRQQFPALVAGGNAIFERDGWTFDLGAKAGFTFGAKATDDHWRRDLRFVEDVYVAPLVGVSASASHQVSDGLNLTLSGKVDRIFLGRSDTSMFDIPTGAPAGGSTNESGADLLSASLQVGLKGSF